LRLPVVTSTSNHQRAKLPLKLAICQIARARLARQSGRFMAKHPSQTSHWQSAICDSVGRLFGITAHIARTPKPVYQLDPPHAALRGEELARRFPAHRSQQILTGLASLRYATRDCGIACDGWGEG